MNTQALHNLQLAINNIGSLSHLGRGDYIMVSRLRDAAEEVLAALSTPPAEDVREELASLLWAHAYDGGHGLMSGEQFAAMVREDLEAILDAFEVRPRGTVTDAEADLVQDALSSRGAHFFQDWEVRTVLNAARGATS